MRSGALVADRFVVETLAGSGGMGRVYRARDRVTGERVALKVLVRDVGSHVARFEHEVQALAELSHPHIVRYVAHGLAEAGEPYLAMEWLEGEDLAARLARGGLSVEDCLRLGSRLADALGAAHARGIVHRDLKPGNVFLVGCRLDQVKVIDFGIARLAPRRGGAARLRGPAHARGAAIARARGARGAGALER
jgi:serine/threonine protein kinase